MELGFRPCSPAARRVRRSPCSRASTLAWRRVCPSAALNASSAQPTFHLGELSPKRLGLLVGTGARLTPFLVDSSSGARRSAASARALATSTASRALARSALKAARAALLLRLVLGVSWRCSSCRRASAPAWARAVQPRSFVAHLARRRGRCGGLAANGLGAARRGRSRGVALPPVSARAASRAAPAPRGASRRVRRGRRWWLAARSRRSRMPRCRVARPASLDGRSRRGPCCATRPRTSSSASAGALMEPLRTY